MASFSLAFQFKAPLHDHSNSHPFAGQKPKPSGSPKFKPFLKEFQQIPTKIGVSKTIQRTYRRLLDAFVDSMFHFVDQPLLPSQGNFAPVEEIGEAVEVVCSQGAIPTDFPDGIYVRNGSNPLFGGLKSTISIFGRSSHIWAEGEGMLHAVYFLRNARGNWTISYRNKYVESETFKLETLRNRPSFLPAVEGDSPAIIAAYLLNMLRFGRVNKQLSNTSIFEHSGKFYATSENHLPQEIDIWTLQSFGDWDVDGSWDRPFTSHPKKAPGSGELVTMGIDAMKPFYVVGVISADGKNLLHEVDVGLSRCILSHEVGITQKYNVIMDHPLTLDIVRLIRGGQLLKYDKGGHARIGVMPRYGDADSVQWFHVEPHCTFHILNTFEDNEEVVVRGCRALGSLFPGPDQGLNKFEWFSRGFKPTDTMKENSRGSTHDGSFFTNVYEWRLNMKTGEVKERNLTGSDFSMDFPMINESFTGLEHKFGYTQVVDSLASSNCGMTKCGGLAKLYFMEPESSLSEEGNSDKLIKVEYHMLAENCFCSGSAFVAKDGSAEEDDGWIVSFVHNEGTNVSQVYIIDAKKFGREPIAKIALPQRVPYGFHGAFFATPNQP